MTGARRAARPKRRWTTVLWPVALGLFLVQALLSLILLFDRPLGYQAVAITGPSMTGTFSRGAEVFVKISETPSVGDIITFRGTNGTLVTHRIVAQDTDGWITKGDHNDSDDPWRTAPGAVIGVVHAHLPLVGYAEIFLANPLGRALTYGPALLLFAYAEIATFLRRDTDAGEAHHRKETSLA